MAELKMSEERRHAEERELRVNTDFEWVTQAENSELVVPSELSGPRGISIRLLECTSRYAGALNEFAQCTEESRLREALVPIHKLIEIELRGRNALGCCLLRRFPLHASKGFCAFVSSTMLNTQIIEPLESSEALGNEIAEPGVAPDAIALFCAVPANRATKLRLARTSDLVKTLDGTTRAVLQQANACQRRDGSHASPKPILEFDANHSPILAFSQQLKENMEFSPEASVETIDALAALDAQARNQQIGFQVRLRADDILFLNPKRWLFALELEHDTEPPCRWVRDVWRPIFAIAPDENESDHPCTPQVFKARLPFSPTSSTSS